MSRLGAYAALAAIASGVMAGSAFVGEPVKPQRGRISSKRSMRVGWQGKPKRWPFAPGEAAVSVTPERQLLYMHSAARRRFLAAREAS